MQRAGAQARRQNSSLTKLPIHLQKQRGAALLVVLLLAGIAVAAGLLSYYNSNTLTLKTDQSTADDLARTRDALIAYAIRGPNRPGEFPCPDTKLPTDLNYGTQDGTCIAGRLGRVPWKTLGIPEPKDASGETLWYTVADKFRPTYSGNINSDTRGSITVYAADGSTALTTEAAAVIFAPGPPSGTQNRATNVSAACTTSASSPTPMSQCATNYLDLATSGPPVRNNATTNGPFIMVGRLPDPSYPNYNVNFNDKLVYIRTDDFMPQVEQRVMRELKVLLEAYRNNSVCKCYPWADVWWPILDGISDVGQNRGHFPTNAWPEPWAPSGTPPVAGTIPALPAWFTANDWKDGIWYAVAKQNAPPDLPCVTCSSSSTLVLDGKPGISALLLFPGPAIGAVPRPSANLADYFEDVENTNGRGAACPETGHIGNDPLGKLLTGALTCDTYVTPTSTARDRDRVVTFTSAPPGCNDMAALMLTYVPCGQPPRLDARCVELAARLTTGKCSCGTSASQLILPPCENTTTPGSCQTAIAALKACK
jgi:hypothetical protein